MERPVSFFLMLFILPIAIIGFIFLVFDLSGISFLLELGLTIAFMLFLALAMFMLYSSKKGSMGLAGGVLILLLLNVFVIVLITGKIGIAAILTALFSAAGLAVAALNAGSRIDEPEGESSEEEHYDKPKYYYSYAGKMEANQESKEELKHEIKSEIKSELKSEEKIAKVFTPGKYVASRKANKFHSPKCDWALRISKPNQVWFNSKDEAQKQGFEADKCVV